MRTSSSWGWFRRFLAIVALVAFFAMGYYLKTSLSSDEKKEISKLEIGKYGKALRQGDPAEREQALHQLIAASAEEELSSCLASDNMQTVDLATAGLWECWLNEQGADARRVMDEGVAAMNASDLVGADRIFRKLMTKYPKWAEAINKEATILYMLGRSSESIELCRKVIALKPNHFGAWNGMALCAIQLNDLTLARKAAREAVRIQPKSAYNRKLLKTIESKFTDV